MSVLIHADYESASADNAEFFLSQGHVDQLLSHLMLPSHDLILDPKAVEAACDDFIGFYDGKVMSKRDEDQQIPWFLTQAATLRDVARKATQNGCTRILVDDGTLDFGEA